MTFRTLFIGFGTSIIGSFIILSTALILFTNFIEKDSQGISEAVESISAAEEIKTNLLLHNREAFLSSLTGNKIYLERSNVIKQKISLRIAKAKEYIASDEERRLIETIEGELAGYFSRRLELESGNLSPLRVYQQISALVDSVLIPIEKLIDLNADQAQQLKSQAERRNQIANMWGAIAIALPFLIMVLTFMLLRKYVYRPLRELEGAIKYYDVAEDFKKILQVGTIEMRNIIETFNLMAEKLSLQRSAQLRFLAGIAHDLRNPLAAIHLSAQLILRKGPEDGDNKKLIEAIYAQTKNLDRMVGDLLDMTRIEAGHLDLKVSKVDIRKLISNAVELRQAEATKHELSVEFQNHILFCYCDETRVTQTLNNLLSNAIKYSPHGGRIQIKAFVQDGQVVISIADEGIGIAKDDIERIFEPFRRTSNTRETIPGVGLGLSISRRIARAHGGDIHVESRPGKGTTFSFIIPLGNGDEIVGLDKFSAPPITDSVS